MNKASHENGPPRWKMYVSHAL